MKRREGYVSNSSSSSYVVVPREVVDDCSHDKWTDDSVILTMFIGDRCGEQWNGEKWDGFFDGGEKEFGWQTEEYHDFESKWNWLVLQAFYDGDEYITQINDFLHRIDPSFEIDWGKVEKLTEGEGGYAYIDHQSVDAKSTFEEISPIGIAEWLLNGKCYINNGNDNG